MIDENEKKRLSVMGFADLYNYVYNLVSQKNKVGISEYHINELISLLESKVFLELETKNQKSVKILQKELLKIEKKKEASINKYYVNLSKDLEKLYEINNKLFEVKLNQDFLMNAYFQLCKLPTDFFSSYSRNKFRDQSSYMILKLDVRQYSNFAKELSFFVNQAIKKIENAVQNHKNSPHISTELSDFEEQAVKLYEKQVDQKSNGKVKKRYEEIVALRSIKKKMFTKSIADIPVKKLSWKFFPKGKWTVEEILKEFGKYISHKEKIDENRIWKIYDNLTPSDCYISQDGFNRYIAFCFEWTNKVVLECPIYGNAIYVIKDNWKEITKLPKWHARQLSQVVVIRHSETWFSRLRSHLRSKY